MKFPEIKHFIISDPLNAVLSIIYRLYTMGHNEKTGEFRSFVNKWVSHWPEDFLWDNIRSEYKFWLVRCRDQQMDSDFHDSSLASWNGK